MQLRPRSWKETDFLSYRHQIESWSRRCTKPSVRSALLNVYAAITAYFSDLQAPVASTKTIKQLRLFWLTTPVEAELTIVNIELQWSLTKWNWLNNQNQITSVYPGLLGPWEQSLTLSSWVIQPWHYYYIAPNLEMTRHRKLLKCGHVFINQPD